MKEQCSACVCRTARKMMRLLCLCVHRNMNVITPPHPTPPDPTGNWSWKNSAVPVSAGQQERWWGGHTGTWTLLPHPTGNWSWKGSAVPVSAGQQERWWGCCACVCTGAWMLLPHPTPPHVSQPHVPTCPLSRAYPMSRPRVPKCYPKGLIPPCWI